MKCTCNAGVEYCSGCGYEHVADDKRYFEVAGFEEHD